MRRPAFSVACILALAISGLSLFAQAQELESDELDSGQSPWSVLSSAAYSPDPTFNGGVHKVDFTEKFSIALGRKIVRLSNGDLIVAGLTPGFLGVASPPYNVGLVRYNSAGQRVAWTNPGSIGFINNNYVIYPNTNNSSNTLAVKEVVDIKVFGNRIFVLVDHLNVGSGNIDSYIYVFGTDGSILSTQTVLGSSLSEYSGAMVIYASNTVPSTTSIVVTASTLNGVWRPTLVRGTLNANNSITFGAPTFPNPGNYCPTNRGCILRSIARSNSVSGAPPNFYLAGTRQSNIPDNGAWDFLVMKVSEDGNPVTSFGGAGVTTVAFDNGITNYDDANSIEVNTTGVAQNEHDDIFVSGFVNRVCKDGVGIAKLKDSGLLDTGFGQSGKLVIGGANPPIFGTCGQYEPASISAMYAKGTALADGKLAIAGYIVTLSEDPTDGMVAVIDAANGNVDSLDTYPYRNAVNGPRIGHSGFWGITDSGNGTFTATGNVQLFGSVQQYGTLRIRGDRIFAHGFE